MKLRIIIKYNKLKSYKKKYKSQKKNCNKKKERLNNNKAKMIKPNKRLKN